MLVFILLTPDDRQAAHGAPPTGGGDQAGGAVSPCQACFVQPGADIYDGLAHRRAHRTD